MDKVLFLVLFAVSFSVLLVPNQEAYAGLPQCGILNIPNGDGSSCNGITGENFCTTWTCNAGFAPSGTNPFCEKDLVWTGTYQCFFSPGQEVGGRIIQIESTSLLLAGAQSSTWLIPVILSAAGIGLVLVRRK